MFIGVDYYPEHWPESRWKTDAELMKAAGFNVVRLAEFAWAMMEPEEGRYDFAWLDRALGILGDNGISAILGTPTAVMPAWLADRYPETLAMQKDGTRITWGVRKNNCFSDTTYRNFSRTITGAMAQHFKDAQNVIGWQTDNEFGHPFCYCGKCRKEFQEWLKAKYGSLDALHKAWGSHFWGHKFTAWEQITIPVDSGSHNPGACLDWQRFYSWLNVRFQHEQVEILRERCPRQFVTHNFMGLFHELDYYDLAKNLDFVSWDNYPVWNHTSIGNRWQSSYAADLMRGLKRKNYWIMEQTAGPGGWGVMGRNVRPGELESVAMQQVAHGADGMVWFRWRSCTAGREQYWHGLLGHDGRPLRRYQEAAKTAKDIRKIEKDLEGTTVKADVAIIYDYDSIWALRIQPAFEKNSFIDYAGRFHRALTEIGVNADLVPPTADLGRYKVVIAPQLYVLPDETAKNLAAYVKKGGILVSSFRTAVKDENSLCHDRTLPGLLSEVFGIQIEEYESLFEEFKVKAGKPIKGEFTATSFADWIKPVTAKVLAGYKKWYLKPYAAVTKNEFKKGFGYYVGALVKEPEFYKTLMAEVLATAGVSPVLTPPSGVEVSVREKSGHRLLFIVNYDEKEVSVKVPPGTKELLGGPVIKGKVTLGRFGSAVLRLK